MYKNFGGFSGSVILRNRPSKFPIPVVLNWRGCRNAESFKCLKVNPKLHGGDRRHGKVHENTKISKSTDDLLFHPMPTSITHISK